MTTSKNIKTGDMLIALTKDEAERLGRGEKVSKETSYRGGIVEFVVQQVEVCPSRETKNILRAMLDGKWSGPDYQNMLVGEALDEVRMHRLADTHFANVIADLERYIRVLQGGNVPIRDVVKD